MYAAGMVARRYALFELPIQSPAINCNAFSFVWQDMEKKCYALYFFSDADFTCQNNYCDC